MEQVLLTFDLNEKFFCLVFFPFSHISTGHQEIGLQKTVEWVY